MYTFLCQVDNRIKYDFVLATLNAIDFFKWRNPNEAIFNIEYAQQIDSMTFVDNTKIPVGSIEFVNAYYQKLLGIDWLKPVNIPDELIPFAKRKIWHGNHTEEITGKTFCKSDDKPKLFTDIIYPETRLAEGNYMFSEHIKDIESEWRCFVEKGTVVSMHNYSYSLSPYFPDILEISKMVRSYKQLDAYTLDVGVNRELGTFIIEVHDFYSCGLYGFSDYSDLLGMLIASHKQKIERRGFYGN